MRKAIETAWETRIQELTGLLCPPDEALLALAGLSDKVRENIQTRMSELSLKTMPMEVILEKLTSDRLQKEGISSNKTSLLLPFRAREKTEETVLKRTKTDERSQLDVISLTTGLSVKDLPDQKQGPMSPRQGTRTLSNLRDLSAEDRGVNMVNIVGAMARPPILYPWPFLKHDPESPVTLRTEEIFKTYRNDIIVPWHRIMVTEWHESLEGSLLMCSSIALAAVKLEFDLQREIMDSQLQNSNQYFNEPTCGSVGLAQANAAAVLGAIEAVVSSCHVEGVDDEEDEDAKDDEGVKDDKNDKVGG